MNILRRFTIPAHRESSSPTLHIQESIIPNTVHIYSETEGSSGGVLLSREAFDALVSLRSYSGYSDSIRWTEEEQP